MTLTQISPKAASVVALCALVLLGGCVAPGGDPYATGPSSTALFGTGTYVGEKVNALRGDLQQLQGTLARHNQSLQGIRNETVQDSQRYHGTVAAIQARLQVGTTPGNPILNQQWNSAQSELDRIGEDGLKMTRLANEVTSSSALSGYLLESVRSARQLSGAVDEDHRQLRVLEDETNRTVVLIERLQTEIADDVGRQQTYVANERQNLNSLAGAIKNGQLYGGGFSASSSYPLGGGLGLGSASGLRAGGTPLVTIRFDKPKVNYERALYAAVKSALDRRPGASFDVVAVSSTGGGYGSSFGGGNSTIQRNAEAVARSLGNMGLPGNRVRMTQTSSPSVSSNGEVQVFVR